MKVFNNIKEKSLDELYDSMDQFKYGIKNPMSRRTGGTDYYDSAYIDYCKDGLKEVEVELRRRKLDTIAGQYSGPVKK